MMTPTSLLALLEEIAHEIQDEQALPVAVRLIREERLGQGLEVTGEIRVGPIQATIPNPGQPEERLT